jgi:hypothetical protein
LTRRTKTEKESKSEITMCDGMQMYNIIYCYYILFYDLFIYFFYFRLLLLLTYKTNYISLTKSGSLILKKWSQNVVIFFISKYFHEWTVL